MPALQGVGHKASAQQIQECGGILSVLLQEKRKRRASRTRMLKRGEAALKSSSVKGMGSIASLLLYSDIPRIIISVFPSSKGACTRKRKCLKGGKSVTASSALTVIICPIVRGKETKSVEFGARNIYYISQTRSTAYLRTPVQGYTLEGLYPYAAEAYECKGKMCGCRFHICQ